MIVLKIFFQQYNRAQKAVIKPYNELSIVFEADAENARSPVTFADFGVRPNRNYILQATSREKGVTTTSGLDSQSKTRLLTAQLA
jgi:hypothetical protein